MRASELDPTCGLLPSGIRSLSFRCVDRDQFCWVMTQDSVKDRLVALPDDKAEAERELATTLARDHGFSEDTARQAARTLFAGAFPDTPAEADAGHSRSARMNLPQYPDTRRAAQRA